MSEDALLRPASEPVAEQASEEEQPLLEVVGITKSWGPKLILDDVDLEIASGTTTAITGRNGIGKTTLLRIAGGLIGADKGIVSLGGLHPFRDRREFNRRLGWLSAGDRGLYARLKVDRQMDLWARLCLIAPDRRAATVTRAIERFELEDLAGARTDRISMGQRQRVRLAMTFLHDPEIVMLDEPLTSLDRTAAACLAQAVDELVGRGGSLLWCSPEKEEHVEFDRVFEVTDTKLVEL